MSFLAVVASDAWPIHRRCPCFRWQVPRNSAVRNKVLRWFVAEESIEKAGTGFQHRGPLIIFFAAHYQVRLPCLSDLLEWAETGDVAIYFLYAGWHHLFGRRHWCIRVNACRSTSIAERFKAFQVGVGLAVLALALVLWVGEDACAKFADRRSRAILGRKIRRILVGVLAGLGCVYTSSFLSGFLSIKFRSLTAFTAANPAIPQGGVTGESKAAILEGLGDSLVASFALIPGWKSYEERHQLALDFLECHKPGFPVVLKPDSGQRGEV